MVATRRLEFDSLLEQIYGTSGEAGVQEMSRVAMIQQQISWKPLSPMSWRLF
jgi:hypothetical protein